MVACDISTFSLFARLLAGAHCSLLALLWGAGLALAPAAVLAQSTASTASTTSAKPAAAPGQTSALPRLLVVGDSLSAEYGLARGSGWVALLGERLARDKLAWQVVNASISGDTTAGGKARLPALLKQHKPAVVVIELGANDALRGLPLTGTAGTEANLQSMVQAAKAAGAKVVVVGIAVPPNYGRAYNEQFVALFGSVARAEKAALVPFFLAGVADVPNAEEFFQADRIHPKATAHPRMLDNVWPALRPLLR
jgi:acyl-CoA thioesterase I